MHRVTEEALRPREENMGLGVFQDWVELPVWLLTA